MHGDHLRALVGLALAAALAGLRPATAQEFYAGRSVDLVIGTDVGGGYDIYARLLARHLHRFIPGSPSIVPKNLPGAGSARAASFLSAVAPKDGSVIGTIFPGAVMAPLLEERAQAVYDPTRFAYLASADSATRVCITHQRSAIRRIEDAFARTSIMGASAAGGSTRDYAVMHRKSTGARFEVVAGYKGTADIFLAMERGEVDGMCGLDWTSLRSQRADWVHNRTVHILLQVALEPEPELSALGVPTIMPYVRDAEDKRAVELVIGQQVFGRPFLAPPGTPAERIGLLRSAFAAAMRDPELIADAERTRVVVAPSTGEAVQALVAKIYSASKATVERARELIRP